MPTYEYECTSCDHKFEKLQMMTADPVKECPECGQESAKRLIGAGIGVIYRGSGFYTTDYKNSGKPKESTKETTKESKSETPTSSCGQDGSGSA
ncbi:MAG: hypothetical protein IEMM0008_1242 [bacterium]|nr:MAG: hypothetical protein IEMM0008_1242 [bacterium]